MLSELLQKQKIRIDAHMRGSRENIRWDNSEQDIHIDKITHKNINGKRIEARIRIPVNSQRPIKIDIVNNVGKPKKILTILERNLVNEISQALSDSAARQNFVNDLLAILANYPSVLSDVEKAKDCMTRLANHFKLTKKVSQDLIDYVDDRFKKKKIERVAAIYASERPGAYFIQINTSSITMGQVENTEGLGFYRTRRKK